MHSIRSVIGSKTLALEHASIRELVDGKTMGRPFSVKDAQYALVLRSPACFPAKSESSTVEGKGKRHL